jgi:regulatory protein
MRPSGKNRLKPKKLNTEQLWEYALAALSRRAQSKAELRRKLVNRAETAQDVAAVLEKLSEYQLADDAKFSEAYAAARLQNQGLGQMRVMRDLRAKQVPERVANEAIEKTYAETNEPDLIAQFLARKYRNKDLRVFLKDPKNLAAAYRRLRTAGFRSGPSLDALKRYASLPDEWPEPDENQEE